MPRPHRSTCPSAAAHAPCRALAEEATGLRSEEAEPRPSVGQASCAKARQERAREGQATEGTGDEGTGQKELCLLS